MSVSHVQLLNNRATDDSYNQPDDYIYNGNLRAENAHQQKQRTQIDHWGGNQK